LSLTRSMSPEQLDWMRRVSERYATVNFMLPYARAAAMNGHPEIASRVLLLICKIQSQYVCQQTLKEWAAFGFPNSSAIDSQTKPSDGPRH